MMSESVSTELPNKEVGSAPSGYAPLSSIWPKWSALAFSAFDFAWLSSLRLAAFVAGFTEAKKQRARATDEIVHEQNLRREKRTKPARSGGRR